MIKRLLVVTSLLLAAGCGGGDGAARSSATTRPSGAPSTAAGIVAGLASAECQKVAAQLNAAGAALAASKGSAPSKTLSDIASALQDAARKVDKTEVRAAIETLAKTFRQLAKDLNQSTSSGATPKAYTDALKALSTPDVAAASKVLNTYLTGGCT